MSGASLSTVCNKFFTDYNTNTPKKLKIIDAYLTYVFFTGVFQVT
jgi:oligosaccharyltransferase complex subunit epsilon